MLHRISSFLTSTLHRGWSCLPAIKLPSAKKTALIGFAFFVIYKLYRSFQSPSNPLSNRVRELETRVNELEEENKELNQQVQAKKTCDKEDINCSADEEEDAYLSAEEGKDSNPNDVPAPSSLPIMPAPEISPLELFKKTFPGAHITFTHQNSEMILSDYLMKNLFRIKDVASCTFDHSASTFTLTYKTPKNVAVTKLPKAMWDAMPWWMPWVVSSALKFLPNAQISQNIKGQFVKTTSGIKIELYYPSISSVDKNYFLKSILIPTIAKKNLLIEVSHRSNQFNIISPIGPQLLAEFIDLINPTDK